MDNNAFFKPTPMYKEYMILDLLIKNKNFTQRELSVAIGVAVSMINSYLDNFENKGLIKRKYRSTKKVEYFVTRKGVERKKVLNIYYLNDSLKIFKSASEDIVKFLNQIICKGYKRILLYGAGEVAEILLQTLILENELPIKVLGVIDDDLEKHNTSLVGYQILPLSEVDLFDFDGILISSYTNQLEIYKKLKTKKYLDSQILHFFD